MADSPRGATLAAGEVPSAFQITTAWRCSFVTDGQLGAVIGDEDGEQARGLRRSH